MNPFKLLLDSSGFSQRQVARNLKIPSGVFNRYITGKRKPSGETALRIIKELASEPSIWTALVSDYLLGVKMEFIVPTQPATVVVSSTQGPDEFGFYPEQ